MIDARIHLAALTKWPRIRGSGTCVPIGEALETRRASLPYGGCKPSSGQRIRALGVVLLRSDVGELLREGQARAAEIDLSVDAHRPARPLRQRRHRHRKARRRPAGYDLSTPGQGG